MAVVKHNKYNQLEGMILELTFLSLLIGISYTVSNMIMSMIT